MSNDVNILWFKRDLRTFDNEALIGASTGKLIIPLYVFEPELWKQPDLSLRHYLFLRKSLEELDHSLRKLGTKLIIKKGNVVKVFEHLSRIHKINTIWSHQETWNGWTFQRDLRVKKWCNTKKIPWFEPQQNGVIRLLDNREGWAESWNRLMRRDVHPEPRYLRGTKEVSESIPPPEELGLSATHPYNLQLGGRKEGLSLLESFLYSRGENYTKEMSSPVTAYESCSRLSAYLSFGTLSIREVFQSSEARSRELRRVPISLRGKWLGAIRSFSGRLRWHCHFIQKLEDEPRIEFENMHPAYDTLRSERFNQAFFDAWKNGLTGYPMVDACMRALKQTGWLNFRMRAMVMSFASYHLWLHWRKPALHLARMFTDYEPGIHYSQVQMQSGSTGINAIRIYNPIKQGIDQDPNGVFIRQWIPELRDMEPNFIHTPWEVPSKMNAYPLPIIEEKNARKAAADKLYGLRKNNVEHKETARKIYTKHGSRKSGLRSKTQKGRSKKPKLNELPLFD